MTLAILRPTGRRRSQAASSPSEFDQSKNVLIGADKTTAALNLLNQSGRQRLWPTCRPWACSMRAMISETCKAPPSFQVYHIPCQLDTYLYEEILAWYSLHRASLDAQLIAVRLTMLHSHSGYLSWWLTHSSLPLCNRREIRCRKGWGISTNLAIYIPKMSKLWFPAFTGVMTFHETIKFKVLWEIQRRWLCLNWTW